LYHVSYIFFLRGPFLFREDIIHICLQVYNKYKTSEDIDVRPRVKKKKKVQ